MNTHMPSSINATQSGLHNLLKSYRPSRILWLGPYVPFDALGADVFVHVPENVSPPSAASTQALFFTSAVHALPFANDAFDLIVCMHFQHLQSTLLPWLAECEQLLVAEGLCVLFAEDYLWVKAYAWLNHKRTAMHYMPWQRVVLFAKRFGFEKVYKKTIPSADAMHSDRAQTWGMRCIGWLYRWCPWCSLGYQLVLVKRDPAWMHARRTALAYT